MKNLFHFIIVASSISSALAGSLPRGTTDFSTSILDTPHYEFAVESAYLLGIINNPHGYEVAAEFLTARMRWGVNDTGSWMRGYNQIYFSAEGQAITRGIENHYFGINIGFRYNFVRPNSRFVPYLSGGLGLGWIDSNPDMRGSQGQDFTFNILSAAGVSYRVGDRLRVDAGLLYEHFSNANQTNPNPSLNLLGPQLGLTYSF